MQFIQNHQKYFSISIFLFQLTTKKDKKKLYNKL